MPCHEFPPKRLLYRLPEVGELIAGFTLSSVYRLVKSGKLKTVELNGVQYVTAAEFDRFVGDLPPAERAS